MAEVSPVRRPEPSWETARLRARPASRADASAMYEHAEAGWSQGSAFLWSLWLKSDGHSPA